MRWNWRTASESEENQPVPETGDEEQEDIFNVGRQSHIRAEYVKGDLVQENSLAFEFHIKVDNRESRILISQVPLFSCALMTVIDVCKEDFLNHEKQTRNQT